MNARHSIERAEVSINGVRSPIVRAGDAQSREAVVFVHGNPGSANDWLDLIEHVAPFGRALAADMPGYGRADKPADFDYTYLDTMFATTTTARSARFSRSIATPTTWAR